MKKSLILLLMGWLTICYCNAEDTPLLNDITSLPKPLASPIESAPDSDWQLDPAETTDILSQTHKLLESDAAFAFTLTLETSTVLVARWQIATGYYLYRDQIQFVLQSEGLLGKPQFPPGEIKDDIKFGRVEVYYGSLEIKLPISQAQAPVVLATTYQGCAEIGVCYPPVQKTTTFDTLPTPPLPETDITQASDGVVSITEDSPEMAPPTAIAALTQLGDALGLAEEGQDFLDPEEAFLFSVYSPELTQVVLKWQIAEGYYLYHDKMKIALTSQGYLGEPQFPPSTMRQDQQFGDVAVYQQANLEVTVPVQASTPTITLEVKYQGCAEAGLCYPPVTKVVDVTLGQGEKLSPQDRVTQLLTHANTLYTLLAFFGFGLLLSLTPCIFPMIPILSSIIIGQGTRMTPYKAFLMSLIYVFAMASTYAVAGVLTGLLGENLQAAFQKPGILIIFSLIFVILALSMFGFYELQLPSALQTRINQLSNRQQGGTLIGVAIMGVLSALIVGPCVAAPLAGALIYIGQTGDAVLGGFSLFFMSLGMGVPLILLGISAGHLLPKAGVWMDNVKAVFGVILLGVAIWMLERILPVQVTISLWASLLIVSAVYMGALDSLSAGISGWRKLWKGIGLILFMYGVLLMIGVASGNPSLFKPLQGVCLNNDKTTTQPTTESLSFKPIKGLEGLNQALTLAEAQNKPVMLDFYADWCVSCKEMENFTFTDAGVQQLLAKVVLLKADVTPNDEQDKALYKHFGIFGPPAILFFSKTGKELIAHRVIGFMPANEFRQHLRKIL